MNISFKKYFFLLIFFISSSVCLAQYISPEISISTIERTFQDTSYKYKNYDGKAIDYILSEVEKNNLTFEGCLKYTKLFSKWDLQSLTASEIWFYEARQKSNYLPSFLLGTLAKYFNVVTSIRKMPDNFLQKAVDDFPVYEKEAFDSAGGYFDLIEMVNKSGSEIFLNQDNLQRVNNIFYENGAYWRYVIPGDSPFPVSDSVTTDVSIEFSPETIAVLDKMKSLGVYAVYNDESFVYLLKDGMLDNSFGYYYKNNDLDYHKENYLFNLMAEQLIMPRFYYYVAD